MLAKHILNKGVFMEKEMLAMATFKVDKFDKFMGWFQSEEGMSVRKTIAIVEKTRLGISPDKSYVLFKVNVTDEDKMKEFVSGNNPGAKEIYAECIDNVQLWYLSKVDM